MPDCIVRFGGNNLNDPQVISTLVSLLKNTTSKHILIVSATNEIQTILDKGIRTLSSAVSEPALILTALQRELDRIQNRFGLTGSSALTPLIEQLETLLQGIHYTGDFSYALKDQVLSYGEKITTVLLAEILQSRGIQVGLVFPEELGLLVTDEYGNASIQAEQSGELVRRFSWGKLTLVPGSYGITLQGKIARTGNRAADYTAAALASIFDAGCLELWQISTPFKTADDRYVPDSIYVESLTYAEASELSYFNYSGIHPRIVEPLTEKHIPIYVYELKGEGKVLRTKINSESIIAPQVVKSVAHTDDIAILKLNGPGVGFKPGILAKVTSLFSDHQINIRSVITAQTSINILLDKASIKRAQQLLQDVDLSSVVRVEIAEHVSLIAIVGHGMQQHHGISAQLFSAVAKCKINVLLSGSGASDLVSYLVVSEHDKAIAIREIHQIFFNH